MAIAAKKTINAAEVLNAIFERHSGPDWTAFAEVADNTGANARRRCDALCMNIWPSKGYAIHGFEIKVSRSDFLKEMQNIAKARAIAQYCDFWWLAAPVGLIKIDELPSNWGLMDLQKNGLKIKKQAPQQANPEPISGGFLASLLRSSRKNDDVYVAREVERRQEETWADLERTMAFRMDRLTNDVKRNSDWIKAFEGRLGIPFQCWQSPENLADGRKPGNEWLEQAAANLQPGCGGS